MLAVSCPFELSRFEDSAKVIGLEGRIHRLPFRDQVIEGRGLDPAGPGVEEDERRRIEGLVHQAPDLRLGIGSDRFLDGAGPGVHSDEAGDVAAEAGLDIEPAPVGREGQGHLAAVPFQETGLAEAPGLEDPPRTSRGLAHAQDGRGVGLVQGHGRPNGQIGVGQPKAHVAGIFGVEDRLSRRQSDPVHVEIPFVAFVEPD